MAFKVSIDSVVTGRSHHTCLCAALWAARFVWYPNHQPSLSPPSGFVSGMGPGAPEEERVGLGAGSHADGVALHQRAAAVGHGEPQCSARTVLQHPGSPQPHRAAALPP